VRLEMVAGAGFRHYFPPSRACRPGDTREPPALIEQLAEGCRTRVGGRRMSVLIYWCGRLT
jgi:hypothetical protein